MGTGLSAIMDYDVYDVCNVFIVLDCNAYLS